MSRLTFRILDVIYALGLGLLLSPLILVVALILLLREGPPVFYGSERMRDPGGSFTLWKFRTIQPKERDGGVTGGDKAARITSSQRAGACSSCCQQRHKRWDAARLANGVLVGSAVNGKRAQCCRCIGCRPLL